jgi:hypothetical protein
MTTTRQDILKKLETEKQFRAVGRLLAQLKPSISNDEAKAIRAARKLAPRAVEAYGTYVWNFQNGTLGYIAHTDDTAGTYTVLTITSPPVQLVVDQSEVSGDGVLAWFALTPFIGSTPPGYPSVGSIVRVIFNPLLSDPMTQPISPLDNFRSGESDLVVYMLIALENAPDTAYGYLACTFLGTTGYLIVPGLYDTKVLAEGATPPSP